MIALKANTGMPDWGKYYQNNDGTLYIAYFEVCKYSSSQNSILVAGQINAYMPFVGYFDIETGEPTKIFRIFSTNTSYSSNGFTTRILEEDY